MAAIGNLSEQAGLALKKDLDLLLHFSEQICSKLQSSGRWTASLKIIKPMELNEIKKELIMALEKVGSDIETRFSNVKVGFSDQLKAHTPLDLLLELFVPFEIDEDYGLCLSVCYFHYDSYSDSKKKSVVFSDRYFVTADLFRGNGNPVASFGSREILINDHQEIEKVHEETLQFIRSLTPTIDSELTSHYRLNAG